MRKTKIICTLGPSSDSYEVIRGMAEAGMNVARINMSHGTHAEHRAKIELIQRVRAELGVSIPVLIDTKGPEVRIRTFEQGRVNIRKDQPFVFTTADVIGGDDIVGVSYEGLCQDVRRGSRILLNNGMVSFTVTKVQGDKVYTTADNAGVLSDHKSMYLPGVQLNLPYLSEQDVQDLEFAISVDADFVAASFVSSAFDVREIKSFLRRKRAAGIEVIAKIESRLGVDNIETIMQESDGIMIARGDMGVEIPFEKLPSIQKYIAKKGRMLGKRIIVATEMLESMIESPRPTRAEISDVANAVYDSASCIMLSGETAAGKDPVGVVRTMARIAEETEGDIAFDYNFKHGDFSLRSVEDAVSHATCNTGIDIRAKAIVAFTRSGMTARMISRFRPNCPIIGVATSEKVYQKLGLSWGVLPMQSEIFTQTDEMFTHARKCAAESGFVRPGDYILIVAGVPVGTDCTTNMIKVEQI